MSKVFTWCVPAGTSLCPRDVQGFAIAEDGTSLGSHVSSNESYSRDDMAHKSKCDIYAEHYPDGYELVWLGKLDDDSEVPEDFKKALAINQAVTDNGGVL